MSESVPRLYEVTRAEKFLKIAMDIFDWVWKEGWDTTTCGGGVWFDNNYSGKVRIKMYSSTEKIKIKPFSGDNRECADDPARLQTGSPHKGQGV